MEFALNFAGKWVVGIKIITIFAENFGNNINFILLEL